MIDTDKHIVKTVKTVEARPKLPVNKLVDQVFEMHEKRPKTRDFAALAKDQLRLSAFRHSIAAIKMSLVREKVFLEKIATSLDEYARSKYTSYLDRFNIKTQNAVINTAMRPIVDRVETLKGALEVIEVCLEDYDKAGWTFKGVNDSLSLGDRE